MIRYGDLKSGGEYEGDIASKPGAVSFLYRLAYLRGGNWHIHAVRLIGKA